MLDSNWSRNSISISISFKRNEQSLRKQTIILCATCSESIKTKKTRNSELEYYRIEY